jgi:PPOX class probable F420-dependent enzyme
MDARGLLSSAQVAVLASVRPDGRAHAVPIVFAIDGDHLYTAVDHKPKSTTRLARLENIAANPQVSVLAQHYNDDWEQLWWVRADGEAVVLESADHRQKAVDLLMAKYAQYRSQAPSGNVIAVRIDRLTGWAAADV